ncbi:hypothetical protein ATKI12_3037 [Kitasatospora sp. Ki12]
MGEGEGQRRGELRRGPERTTQLPCPEGVQMGQAEPCPWRGAALGGAGPLARPCPWRSPVSTARAVRACQRRTAPGGGRALRVPGRAPSGRVAPERGGPAPGGRRSDPRIGLPLRVTPPVPTRGTESRRKGS